MPIQQLPSEFGNITAYTGLIDVRPAGGYRSNTDITNRVTFNLYDLPPLSNKTLLNGELDFATLRRSADPTETFLNMSFFALLVNDGSGGAIDTAGKAMMVSKHYATAQTNDIVTLVRLSDKGDFFLYNHTSGVFGSQANQQSVWQMLLKEHGWSIFWMIFLSCLLPVSVFIGYRMYKKIKEKGQASDGYQNQIIAWVKENCTPIASPIPAGGSSQIQSI